MARQRFIWPDLWEDPVIGRMTPVEQLFFIGCFSNADDEGRLLGDVAFLRSTIFRYQDISLEEVRQIRDSVVQTCNNLVLYTVDDIDYLAFLKWSDYQKPKYAKPSKLPAPEEGKIPETFPQSSGNDSEELPENSAMGWVGLGSGLDRDGLDRDGGDKSQSPDGDNLASLTPGDVQDAWNEICGDVMPKIRNMTKNRRNKLRTRCKEGEGRGLAWWREYFTKVRASPFCCGDNDRNWVADFDWAIKSEDVITRVFEGKYANGRSMRAVPGKASEPKSWEAIRAAMEEAERRETG